MSWILYLVVILWGIFGILALILPKKAKDFSLKLTHAAPYWIWGIIALIIAVLLWRSADLLFIQVLAVIAGIKGLTLLFLPKSKMDGWLNYWTGISDVLFRVLGIVLLVVAYYIFQMLI